MSTPRPSLLVAAGAIVLSIKRGGLPGQRAGTSGPAAWTYFAHSRRVIPPGRFSRLQNVPRLGFIF